jgi:hypothetical protein
VIAEVTGCIASYCRTTAEALLILPTVSTWDDRRIEHSKYIEARSIAKALIESVCRKKAQGSKKYKLETYHKGEN